MTLLDDEIRRIGRNMQHVLRQSAYSDEVPIRIHERGPDDGHGLGGPAFHPRFLSWLQSSGVCLCDERDEEGQRRGHRPECNRNGALPRLGRPNRRSNPRRLNKALRRLRNLSPETFPIVRLTISHGYRLPSAWAAVNESRYRRGEEPYTNEELSALTIAGFDLLTEVF
jgi:hypothetical protein